MSVYALHRNTSKLRTSSMAFPELAPLFPKWNGRKNLDSSPSFPAGLTSKGLGRDGPVYQALAFLHTGLAAHRPLVLGLHPFSPDCWSGLIISANNYLRPHSFPPSFLRVLQKETVPLFPCHSQSHGLGRPRALLRRSCHLVNK